MPIFATDYIAYSEALTETDYPDTSLSNESINKINNVSDSFENIVLTGNRIFALKFPTSDLGIPSAATILGFTVKLTFISPVLSPVDFAINSNTQDLSNSNPFSGISAPPTTSHPSDDGNTYATVETGYEVGNYTLLNNSNNQITPYITLIQNDELAIRFAQTGVGFMIFDKGGGPYGLTPALKIHYEYGTKTTISGNTKVKLQNQNKIKLI